MFQRRHTANSAKMQLTPQQLDDGDNPMDCADIARMHRYVLAWDDAGRVIHVSNGLRRLTGETLLGTPCETWLPEIRDAGPETASEEPAYWCDTPLMLPGRQIRVAATVLHIPAADADGPTRAAILRLAESNPHDSPTIIPHADFLADVLDNAPDGVVALDHCGFVIYANPAALEMTGLASTDLLQRPVAYLAQRMAQLPGTFEQLRSPGELECELQWTKPSGRTAWFHISSRPLALPDGRAAGRVVFARDIGEQRRRQSELEEKNAELESQVSTVAHDLRSPLVSLLGFSRLLRQDYESTLDEMGHHFLDRIEQAGRTMESLIEDLLTLSKIGELRFQPTWIDAREVLEQVRAELKPKLEEKNILLRLPSEWPVVLCDRTRLYQIFSNLVGNAIRHGSDGTPPEIRVQISHGQGEHVVSVHDNGRGIETCYHERIFQAFQTVDRKDRETSAGMGLAIVRKIAALHGGRAWVESRPGKGASFHVSLSHD